MLVTMSLKHKATGVTLLLSGTRFPKCSQRLQRTHGILGPGTAPMVLDVFLVLLSLFWRKTLPCSAQPSTALLCPLLTCHYLSLLFSALLTLSLLWLQDTSGWASRASKLTSRRATLLNSSLAPSMITTAQEVEDCLSVHVIIFS